MRQIISNVADVKQKIEAGRKLLLAGDEDALRQLPKGDWIGGTIPYFISSEQGGVVSRELICATDITDVVTSIDIVTYDPNSLARIYSEGPKHGFSFIIIPAASKTHLSFALNGPNYKDFGVRPLIGWVAGVHLSDLGKKTPKVINGQTGEMLEEGALVLQAQLPDNKAAEIGIINLFEQGDGDILTFNTDDFAAKDVLVNGERRNLSAYIVKNKLDTKLPLVADYYGAWSTSASRTWTRWRGWSSSTPRSSRASATSTPSRWPTTSSPSTTVCPRNATSTAAGWSFPATASSIISTPNSKAKRPIPSPGRPPSGKSPISC